MWLTIYGHTVLKEEFFAFFGRKRKEEPEEVYNVLGQKMIFNVAEQNEVKNFENRFYRRFSIRKLIESTEKR